MARDLRGAQRQSIIALEMKRPNNVLDD